MYERCVARQGRRWAWALIFHGFYVIFIWISQLFWDFLTISWASPFPSHARAARYTFVKAPISPATGRLLLYLIVSHSCYFLLTLIVAHCLTLNVNCPIKRGLLQTTEMKRRRAQRKINSKHHFSKSTLITTGGATWKEVRQQKGNVLALRSAVGAVKELQVKRGN